MNPDRRPPPIEFGGYEPYIPIVADPRPLHLASRAEAKAEFDDLMARRAERRQAFRALLERAGVARPDEPLDLDAVDAWFARNVRLQEGSTERFESVWYAVMTDYGITLGDLLIEAHPWLSWVFWTRHKKDDSYQRAVVAGFRSVPKPHYYVDFAFRLVVFAFRAVRRAEVAFGRRQLELMGSYA